MTPAQLLTTDSDDWLRTELSLVSLESNTGTFDLIDGGAEHFLGYSGGSAPGTVYWKLIPAATGFTATITTLTTSNTRVRANTRSIFALVYVNSVGQVTGYAAQTNSGTAVTASCLVSAAPGTILPGGSRATVASRRTQSSVMWRRSP